MGGRYGEDYSVIYSSSSKGAITSKIKHAVQFKTSPAKLAQLLQPSLALDNTPSFAAS